MNPLKHCCIAIFLEAVSLISYSQNMLNRTVSLQVSQQRLEKVLELLSNKGNFYFSYNPDIIKTDSLVSIHYMNKSVYTILQSLFNESFEFKESGNYIIIRKAPARVSFVTKTGVTDHKTCAISGYVHDEQTGAAINKATIYEKNILVSAFTNKEGYFKIKFKNSKIRYAALTVSKEFYKDTIVTIQTNRNQEVSVNLIPEESILENVTIGAQTYISPEPLQVAVTILPFKLAMVRDTPKVEKYGFSRFLLSAKQKVQSANLKLFFTTRPFQISLTPVLGTHGYLSAQVVNKFSLNVLGGYTAGTGIIELGGLFNIDKKNVKHVQLAGLFNKVGGNMNGFQAAGLSNTVLDSTTGFQAAGLINFVKEKFTGVQTSGMYNKVTGTLKGFQAAGIANIVNKKMAGIQMAGIANISHQETNGLQLSGFINYAKKLKGVQIGIINFADSSDGYSIGLINFVKHGYKKLSIFSNEVMNVNIAYKSGNPKLYSILTAGLNAGANENVYSYGFGFGSQIYLDKRKLFHINPELNFQYLYLGSWNYTNLLNKANLAVNYTVNKSLSVFAGPSFNLYVSDQHTGSNGYRFPVPAAGYKAFRLGHNVTGWFGWNAGITIF